MKINAFEACEVSQVNCPDKGRKYPPSHKERERFIKDYVSNIGNWRRYARPLLSASKLSNNCRLDGGKENRTPAQLIFWNQ